ncbi:MAG: hypothetical protein P8J27_03870 [Mariniblastus sp.]|nr:hypothetical protein [Mariniblastus sp.]
MLRLSFLFAMFTGLCLSIPSLKAEEPAQMFLEALRDNGYYDVAIEYLDSLESSDLISDEFRSSLPFEKAETLIGSTQRVRDLEVIESRLDQAQKLLTDYASKNQSLEVSARTLRYQGNLLYQRSNIYLTQAKADRATESEKNVLRAKARTMLEQSQSSYIKARDQLKRLLDPTSPDAIKIDAQAGFAEASKRNIKRLQTGYTQVRLRLPMVTEQLADTYPQGDPTGKKLLTDAAKLYSDVYDDYRRFHSGLKACVYSARCQQKLGNPKPALDLLAEIFELGNNSSIKSLKLEAYVLAAECWSSMKPYPHVEVVKRLDPAVGVLNRIEVRKPDWLRVQLELAIGKHAQAAAVKAKGGPKANKNSGEIDRAAAKLLRSVARVPSPYREKARELLIEWDVSLSNVADASAAPPKTFGDARQKAKDIISEIELTAGGANELRREFKSEKDEAKKSALQSQLAEADAGVLSQAEAALEMLNLALGLQDDSTVRADINNIRYLQCYCYFASRQYFEAALIGEYLLAKYPSVSGTQQAMSLMIQSYSSLLDSAKEAERKFEISRLTAAADEVIARWPGSSESGIAASTMTRLAINTKDFKAAEKYLLQIPSGSSYRNALAVRVGQRMWLDVKAKMTAGDEPSSYQKQLVNAKNFMADGVSNASLDTLDYETALGALMLVDAYLVTNETDQAVRQLETAAIAPLDLVKQKHPAIMRTSSPGIYSRETYRVAMKVYLAAMKSSADKQKWITKAQGVISRMRQDMQQSNDPKDRNRVTVIYRMIAKQLKSDFDSLSSQEEKRTFAGSLVAFLSSISEDSKDPKTILWAGSTLRVVGDSLLESGLVVDAKPFFKKSVEALNKAEKIGFADDPQLAEMTTGLKRERALSQRGAGNFEVAIDQLAEILKENSNAINIQIDASMSLQAWAKATQRQKTYVEATKGARSYKNPKTKRNTKLIWGWEKIALATRKNPKYRSTYYEALYHVAECRLEYGILAKNSGAIKSAGNEITKERERDPTFAGMAKWKQKFEELESRINAAK